MINRGADIRDTFIQTFGSEPLVIRAPGRINIIGEHTDYNDGFVLPGAIDLAAYIFIQKSNSDNIRLISVDLDESYDLSIKDKLEPIEKGWVNYFLGVIDQFNRAEYPLGGFNLMFSSDIPIGAGLSSSAALECGFGRALSELFQLGIEPVKLAQMGQLAEHKFAGVQCGIMDQFASCLGKYEHVIKLDCQNLSFEYIPADFGNYELVLFDSCVKHNLGDTEYNKRREECKEGLEIIKKYNAEIESFREVTFEDLEKCRSLMSEAVYKRCKYVVEEDTRVALACEALSTGDIRKVGDLMSQTHKGLRDDYEVSCDELDTLISIASGIEGYAGGRMMGGGFGGCTINLIERSVVDDVTAQIEAAYKASTGISTKVYRVAISDGVGTCKEEIKNEI